MSNIKVNNLKSGIKNGNEETLNFSSNIIGNFNDETNAPHRPLLTNTQASRLRKAFANNSSVYIRLSKTQWSKIGQSGRFLGRLLGPLLKTGLSLIINVLKLLAKSVLIPLGLTLAVDTTIDAAINKNQVQQH